VAPVGLALGQQEQFLSFFQKFSLEKFLLLADNPSQRNDVLGLSALVLWKIIRQGR